MTWAVIWTNLAYNSIISKWYMLNAPAGEIYEKNDLIFLLGDDYSKSTRDNAVTALLETFRHSPIGTVLKQGIPIPSGNSFKFSKQGWNTPDAVAILYALYMWAEATGRYTFTLGQMEAARGNAEAKGVDPVSIFGINPDRFKDILQDICAEGFPSAGQRGGQRNRSPKIYVQAVYGKGRYTVLGSEICPGREIWWSCCKANGR